MSWFYDAAHPELNTKKALNEAVKRIAGWWGLSNHEIVPTYGSKDGTSGSAVIGYPALKDTVLIDPISDLEKTVFHEMAHIALEPAIQTVKAFLERFMPYSTVDGVNDVMHDMFEEFVQKMDRAVDAARRYERG